MSVQLELPCGEQWLDAVLDDTVPPPLRGYGQPATAKPRPWRQVRRTLSRPITNLNPIDIYHWGPVMTDLEDASMCEPSERRPERSPLSAVEAVSTKNEKAGNGKSSHAPVPGVDGIPKNAITHGACDQWWTGGERSHCGGCHLTFSSLTTFDRHRKGGRCNNPADVGLIARDKPYGTLWALPAPEGGYSALFGRSNDELDEAA